MLDKHFNEIFLEAKWNFTVLLPVSAITIVKQ